MCHAALVLRGTSTARTALVVYLEVLQLLFVGAFARTSHIYTERVKSSWEFPSCYFGCGLA